MAKSNIVLYGFGCTGKSSVARRLGEVHGLEVVDTDELLVDLEGASIDEIVQARGEVAFRGMERDLVRDVAQKDGAVIATGSGVPLDPRNVEFLAMTGVGILLTASPATVLARMKAAPNPHPFLKPSFDLGRVAALMSDRRVPYSKIPHRVETNGMTVETATLKVWDLFQKERKHDS